MELCTPTSRITGKERDAETGLDNFGARLNSSSLGRFLTPDPSADGINPLDPQSWNLYSYTHNRPLRFVDVNGNWATAVHADVISATLSGYLSAGELKVLVAEQYVMDSIGNQSARDSYQHAQRAPNQSPEAADDEMWKFVAGKMEQASAGVNPNGTFSPAALQALGDAMHTLQDSTSPIHRDSSGVPTVWAGLKRENFGIIPHYLGESSPERSWAGIGQAIRLTLAAYMQANPGAAAQHGLTAATFDKIAASKISDYVHANYNPMGPRGPGASHVQEEAARQCALGNPAACNGGK